MSSHHHCCYVVRNLSLPQIFRVSRRPFSFSDRFYPKSIRLSQPASISRAAERNIAIDPVGRATDIRALPGLASRRGGGEKVPVGRRNGIRSNFSSWEESADSYFSRNGGKKLRDERDDGDRRRSSGNADYDEGVSVEMREEEAVSESADSPRWNRIKTRYKDFADSRSRSEKAADARRWNKQETWDQTAESSVPKMAGQCVYGVGPVLAALTVARREFHALYVQEGLDLTANNRKKKDKKGVEKILKLADKVGLRIVEASKHDLNMAAENRPHQGLVLDASPLELVDIRELEPIAGRDQRAPLWVALDEVTDPQNLGAIVRSAYFFGAEGVVLCAKNSAPLSGVVSKASAGSLELIELRSCKNMMKFLASSMENGWRVLGGSASSKALNLREVEAGLPTVLVLGSEGHGLRPLVERCCTQLIRISGSMAVGEGGEMDQEYFGEESNFFFAVESLNVSVAAGVLLYHLVGDAKHLSVEQMNRISS